MPSETVCLSHRERKKQATRRAIHDAAFELVEESGFTGVTVEAISERAGVAPRTFWSYFPSKEAAVLDVAADRPEVLRSALLARPADEDPLATLRCVLVADMVDRSVDSERALRRARLVRREPQLMAATAAAYDEIERALVAGIAERLGQDPEADLLPALVRERGLRGVPGRPSPMDRHQGPAHVDRPGGPGLRSSGPRAGPGPAGADGLMSATEKALPAAAPPDGAPGRI